MTEAVALKCHTCICKGKGIFLAQEAAVLDLKFTTVSDVSQYNWPKELQLTSEDRGLNQLH